MGNRRLLAVSLVAALLLGFANSTGDFASAKTRGKTAAKSKSSSKSKNTKSRSSKGRTSSKRSTRAKSSTKGKKLSKSERAKARWRAKAAAEARRRELARLAAIRRFDESLKKTALGNITVDNLKNEDPVVRQAALDALGDQAGTVVVMDPNSGRVLSIVNQKMAIGSAIKPCSTFKPVIALAALSEHLMDESQTRVLRACNCEMDMDDALAYSNNEYFQQLGLQLGLEKITSYAKMFGFGERTGINLPGEVSGALPSEIPSKGLGRVASHGDGIGLTAIQLACFVSAIANGGSLYQPQVVAPDHRFMPVLRRQLKIDPKYRRAVLEGMIGAVDYGTAVRARNSLENIAGKTGSCIGLGSWIGLFASFADVENPNLVIIVITRGSHSRGKYSADIAGKIYEALSARYGSTAKRPRRVGDDDEPVPTLSNK